MKSELQLLPRDLPVPPIWGEHAESSPLDVIVFSKDRAAQLDALLRSIRAYLTMPHRLHVLYTTSSPAFERGYDRLRLWHPGVRWVADEGTFAMAMRNLMADIENGPGRYLMFAVDDMMFTRPFTAGPLLRLLDDDEDVLAVSLRLGENITYCYTGDYATRPPDFSRGYRWAWKEGSPGYWKYPMSQDGHIYRVSDFAELLPRLQFSGPNSLESAQAGRPFPRPDLVCEQFPSVINIAANRVQSVFPNRCGTMTAEFLNDSFLSGLAVDVQPFAGRRFNACHIDDDLPLIEDARNPEPPSCERIERDGRGYLRIDLRRIPTFILNCSDDTQKRLMMEEQMAERGMNHEFVRTIRVQPGWVGVALGHLKALRLTRARPPFLILEDDCVFDEHFQAVIEVPEDADCLYLSASVFGLPKPGERGWGQAGATLWERYDTGYLRVHNMLARHALLYLKPDFQAAVIESQVEALTNRHLAHMGDIGLAVLQPSWIALLSERSMCRQLNREATAGHLAELLPDNEVIDGKLPQPGSQRRVMRKPAAPAKLGLGMISHKYRFIYFQMPKNASSTIRRELRKPRYECEEVALSSLDDETLGSYFKFAFLRDPVSRLVSAYQEVSFRNEMKDSRLRHKPFMDLEDNAERFDAFLDEVESGKWDPHVETQSGRLGRESMEFYGRVETLAEDLQTVFDMLNLGQCPALPKRRSRDKRKSEFGYHRFNIDHRQLSPDQVERIRSMYQDDVDLLQAFCPAPPLFTTGEVGDASSQARALAILRYEDLTPIELFQRVNEQHERCFVHVFGNRGFLAEVLTVARAALFAWAHGYRLLLDSAASSWAHREGWKDYFVPFCGTSADLPEGHVVEHCEFGRPEDRETWRRMHGFAPQRISFGHEKILGFQNILAFFTAMIFRVEPETQAVADRLYRSLELPDDFDAIHIRRGDKVGSEDSAYPAETYLNHLGHLSQVRTLFVMSDDYAAVEEVRDCLKRLGKSIDIKTLAQPDRSGFDVDRLRNRLPFLSDEAEAEDGPRPPDYVRDATRELIAECLIAARSKRFASTWRSNVGNAIWFLRSDRKPQELIQPFARSASVTEAPPLQWSDAALRSELLERRAQYVCLNDSFSEVLQYRLGDGDVITEMTRLAYAMVVAMSRRKRLVLDTDSLKRRDDHHWHDLVHPPVFADRPDGAEPLDVPDFPVGETGRDEPDGWPIERLDFGVVPLHGAEAILGFFLPLALWPSARCRERIQTLLSGLPLDGRYHALHLEGGPPPGHSPEPGSATASRPDTAALFEMLDAVPDPAGACVIGGDDPTFEAASRHLAKTRRHTRAFMIRRAKGESDFQHEIRTLAELSLALRARRFVSASDSHFAQAVRLMHTQSRCCRLIGGDSASADPVAEAHYSGEVQLRDGSVHEFQLSADAPLLEPLRALAAGSAGSSAGSRLFQLPQRQGRAALTFSGADVRRVSLVPLSAPSAAAQDPAASGSKPDAVRAPHHPLTHVTEGHLGGYLQSRHPLAEQFGTLRGDPATYTPELWQWAIDRLGVGSMLDVGCGEGHAAAYFRDRGCSVLGVDGSVQARRDSVIPGAHRLHDYTTGPCVPEGEWDLVWSCEFVEHVEERYTQNFLATFACARKYVLMTFAPPGQRGWHHVNCQPRDYWVERLSRLGFQLDESLTRQARELAGAGHFQRNGLVLVRANPERSNRRGSTGRERATGPLQEPSGSVAQLAVNSMPVLQQDGHDFLLFLDIFVHPGREKVVAVLPWYHDDWQPAEHGIDFEHVFLLYRGRRIRGRFIPHRLDSWEPCALLDFEDPLLTRWLKRSRTIRFGIEAGPHRRSFKLATPPPPAFDVLMSLVVRNENRWLRHFLEYYLGCLAADHVLVYDNGTSDRQELMRILRPYQETGQVTCIPWDFRWRNIGAPRKMIAQPQQEAHSLNRYAHARWIGFFDVDEFLRLPDTNLKEFLRAFEAADVDGLSFGLRWFHYDGVLDFDEVRDVPLTFREARRSRLGRKRQKLVVAPAQVRFLRLHWLEEGGRELPIDDTDLFFHHYGQRPNRYRDDSGLPLQHDDHMLQFADRLSLDAPLNPRPDRPAGEKDWIDHIGRAIALAETGRSRAGPETLRMDGMSGIRTRHFYNNLAGFAGCRYLEIGCHHGSSTCAALDGNELDLVCIDNFSQFGADQQVFENQARKFRDDSTLRLIAEDCFAVDPASLGPFDIYLYDGAHGEENHERAIRHFASCLAPLAVVLIDDWNREPVRAGTEQALDTLGLKVAYRKEIFSPVDKDDSGNPVFDADGWWNGLAILLLDQRS